MGNEIILYQAGDFAERIEVRVEDETVWLNRQQLAILFGRDLKTIGKHVNNIFSEGEKKWLWQNLRQPLSTVLLSLVSLKTVYHPCMSNTNC